jgi:hypothetical protein
MAAIADRGILETQQRAFRNDFRSEIRQLGNQLQAILVRAAGEDGELTFNEFNRVQSETGFAVMRFFVGATGNAFTEQGEALAPFGELLNLHYAEIVWKAVKVHHDWMVRHVPKDLQRLMTATVVRSPALLPAPTIAALILQKAERIRTGAEREMRVQEQEDDLHPIFRSQPDQSRLATVEQREHLRLFRPNPLAEIDPERLWVRVHEPRQIINDFGEVRPYRLSDAV